MGKFKPGTWEGNSEFYICDRTRSCNSSSICGTLCTHTCDEKHAKNTPEDRIFDTHSFKIKHADGTYELIEKAWEVEKNDRS